MPGSDSTPRCRIFSTARTDRRHSSSTPQTWQRESAKPDDWVNGTLSADELSQVYHWLSMVADAYPMSSAARDFEQLGRKIKTVVPDVAGRARRLRGRDEERDYRAYDYRTNGYRDFRSQRYR